MCVSLGLEFRGCPSNTPDIYRDRVTSPYTPKKSLRNKINKAKNKNIKGFKRKIVNYIVIEPRVAR